MDQVSVTNDGDNSRYEVWVDGELAGAAFYVQTPTDIRFTHTEIEDRFAGKGIGGRLVQGALDDVAAQGARKVVPICSFTRSWIEKHPDYQPLLTAPAER